MTNRQRSWMIILICLFALGQFQRSAPSVIADGLRADLSLSASGLSLLVAAMFYANVVCQLPAGAVLDRIGPRRMLIIGMVLVALGTLGFAWAESYHIALTARVLIGAGSAVMLPSTYVLIARNFPAAEFGRVNGLVITFGSFGGLLATYPLALIVAQTGWRVPLYAVALAAAALAFASFAQPRTAPARAVTEPTEPGPDHLNKPLFVGLCVLGFISFAPITVFTGLWGGPWLTDRYGVSLSTAGAVLFAYFFVTLIAAWVYGQLDFYVTRRMPLIFGSVAISLVSLGILAIWPDLPLGAAVFVLGIMIFCQQFYIPLGAAMKAAVPAEMLGRATGVFGLVSVLGIPVLQGVSGQVLETAQKAGLSHTESYAWLFAAVAGVLTVCAAISALILAWAQK